MTAVDEFDIIVIGVGGIGSAALFWLTKSFPDKKILGLEQFTLDHANGGSHDYSRIIKIYHEEKFNRLTPASYDAWRTVELDSGLQLVHRTGGLIWATPDSGHLELMDKYFQVMRKTNTECVKLSGEDIMKRWPQMTIPKGSLGVFDPDAGLVDAILANAAHQQMALQRGATIIDHCKVKQIIQDVDRRYKLITDKGSFLAKKLIVTAGAWINDVLKEFQVHVPVKVSQEQVSYYATPHVNQFVKDKFPIQLCTTRECEFYTLPIHGIAAFKIGIDAGGPGVSADNRTFVPDQYRLDLVETFLRNHIPKAMGRNTLTRTCLYTMTFDRSFLIDTLACRGHPNVIVCCGAGHAYKFASLFGKILAELAVFGATHHQIDDFCFQRPAIVDPSFVPTFSTVDQSKAHL